MIDITELSDTTTEISEQFLGDLKRIYRMSAKQNGEVRAFILKNVANFLKDDALCGLTSSTALLKSNWNDYCDPAIPFHINPDVDIDDIISKWVDVKIEQHSRRTHYNSSSDYICTTSNNGKSIPGVTAIVKRSLTAYINHKLQHNNFETFNHADYTLDAFVQDKEADDFMMLKTDNKRNQKIFIKSANEFFQTHLHLWNTHSIEHNNPKEHVLKVINMARNARNTLDFAISPGRPPEFDTLEQLAPVNVRKKKF